MTLSVKVHVNGNYRSIVHVNDGPDVPVGPNEEKSIPLTHGIENVIRVGVEEYLGATQEPLKELDELAKEKEEEEAKHKAMIAAKEKEEKEKAETAKKAMAASHSYSHSTTKKK